MESRESREKHEKNEKEEMERETGRSSRSTNDSNAINAMNNMDVSTDMYVHLSSLLANQQISLTLQKCVFNVIRCYANPLGYVLPFAFHSFVYLFICSFVHSFIFIDIVF